MAFYVDLAEISIHPAADGDHNRHYYLTVTVTNNAGLSSTETKTILVDSSPPETGVVFDGIWDSPDIDFQSSKTFNAYWKGFYDHESGIHHFRYAVSEKCLSNAEIQNATFLQKIYSGTTTLHTLQYTDLGLPIHIVTILAFNNALDPSNSACSDGVTLDDTPPFVNNIVLQNAFIKPGVVCQNQDAFIVHHNFIQIPLSNITNCHNMCIDYNRNDDKLSAFKILQPADAEYGEEESHSICLRYSKLSDPKLFLARDSVAIHWTSEDNESGIHHFEIGLSSSSERANNPDLLEFVSTELKPTYINVHPGIGHGSTFFVTIRSINKAFDTTNVTLGPVAIDETPPEITEADVTVQAEINTLIIKWTDEAFKDKESGILSVEYALGKLIFIVLSVTNYICMYMYIHYAIFIMTKLKTVNYTQEYNQK